MDGNRRCRRRRPHGDRVSIRKKKKEGFTVTDRRRIVGLFWVTISMSLLVGGLIWLSG